MMTPSFRLAAAALLGLALAGPVLAQSLGQGPAPAQRPPQGADDPLPEAPGKEAVVRVCTACHDATQFAFARHTPEEWDNEITKMQSAGAEMTPEDQLAISAYLATNFPKPAPAPAATAASPGGR